MKSKERSFKTNLPSFGRQPAHRRRKQGAGGAAALPTLEKFAKISNNRAENWPKVGQNLGKQWIFYRAAPLNFISPYAYEPASLVT